MIARDYPASMACLRNAQRAGSCVNMILGEFLNAKKHEQTGNFVINIKNHKTKRRYGPTQIVLTPDLHTEMSY